MLLQLLIQHPSAVIPIVRSTPLWVWGLLAGLLALGASQARDRTASLARVSLFPVAMTIFSAWGALAALGTSPHLKLLIATWLLTALITVGLVARGRSAARYDATTRRFALPGSLVPLLLITAIFLVKYVVGVDMAMAPQLVRNLAYVLCVAALYGTFCGVFMGRALRLWRLPTLRAG
ncbi:MAG: hypothetical protein KF871_06235 [Hydrogenophaga sp.]|uniref:DUF6622 family protein n=1 Tax=Hydrogenophaga sp. TaxID=1904254 RepID=UPI001E17F279|nr:DUF6622 family protein [Hydrogenophaga sp.]MBX3609479.1 hypothetical protein [Hydrogenophaga sp.]